MCALFGYFAVVIGSALCAYYLGLMNGAIYIPTDRILVEKMLDVTELKPTDTLVDLGSGDGRLVIAAAKRGARAVGYEINPILVWLSKRNAKRAGVSDRATFYAKDFWSADLSPYSVVTVFGIGHIMKRLERKLQAELKPSSRVVCNLFTFPEWKGEKEEGVFLYIR
jgi:ribosomal protein L11 methylase PrmA